MFRVCVRLGVAVGALEDAIVARIGVAGRTDSACSAVIHVEPGVVERRAQPTGRRVANGAGVGETCRDVIRTVGRLVVGSVATVTIRG